MESLRQPYLHNQEELGVAIGLVELRAIQVSFLWSHFFQNWPVLMTPGAWPDLATQPSLAKSLGINPQSGQVELRRWTWAQIKTINESLNSRQAQGRALGDQKYNTIKRAFFQSSSNFSLGSASRIGGQNWVSKGATREWTRNFQASHSESHGNFVIISFLLHQSLAVGHYRYQALQPLLLIDSGSKGMRVSFLAKLSE